MRFFPVCLLVLCGALSAAAQSPEPLKTKALSFNINGLYLSGLNGGVGGKLWISESRALVASVNGGISHDVREAPDATSLDTEYTTTSFGVQAGVEQHFPWRPGLSPFLTGGGSFGRYGTVNRSGSVGSPYRQAEWRYQVAANAGFGLEYWLAPRISIAGQQLLNVGYSFGRYEPYLSPDRVTRSFAASLGTSSLILSVYL